ncbi:MAG TPA: penicillin-binding protein 1C [Bacteroidia bacterium]|jgi:penicillin-binding protein 1C|nr:penicillin-binding protein 1C [Bacteroidia bacterium]
MGGSSESGHKINLSAFCFFKTKRRIALLIVLLISSIWFYFCLPSPLFPEQTSTVLEDHRGALLSARIAADGQWHFPATSTVSQKFISSITQFEDRAFFYHPGVNPLALLRATYQNIKSGKIKSGGSTLSMQVIRLARKGKERTFFEKIIEMILAVRLEMRYSKYEILCLYASNAPFGSNVIGIDAASWRYFGRDPEKLSWAEVATLAVLPNAPSLIYPGKNQNRLFLKRNRLLDQLFHAHLMDSTTCELSKKEDLPDKPHSIPQFATHLLQRAAKEGNEGKRIRSTLDIHLQQKVNTIIENYHKILKANEIHNACALVLEVNTGNVKAYVGNTDNPGNPEYEGDVDIINAPRSTGSILKPFLYASMLNDGDILPNTLVPDIPTQISGYIPQNYNITYDGAVPASRALARSLNIPAVRMLQNYGIEKFNFNLKKLGMTTLNFTPDHYGLSIILGGAEGKLWDIASMYASMARTLNHYTTYNGTYDKADIHPAVYVSEKKQQAVLEKASVLSAASIYLTFQAMVEVSRPDYDVNWKSYSSSAKIAWKTGTSFGFRDGWAVGVTPDYVVAVWTGNADGEGRPGLTGIQTAAPILFDIFSVLKTGNWFLPPFDEMKKEVVCHQSGCIPTEFCEPLDTTWVPLSGMHSEPCKYHRLIHLDKSGKYRVTSNCENVSNMQHVSWFVLPPSMEWYYKFKNPHYKELPPMRGDCQTTGLRVMEIIYPKQLSKIYVPLELDGSIGKTVFQVAHRYGNAIIYWHLDGKYIGSTQNIHQMGLAPDEGMHQLTLVDQQGESTSIQFEIISKKRGA